MKLCNKESYPNRIRLTQLPVREVQLNFIQSREVIPHSRETPPIVQIPRVVIIEKKLVPV